jgi:hypothetical protein
MKLFEFIKECKNFSKDLQELEIVIQAENKMLFEPKIKILGNPLEPIKNGNTKLIITY